MIKLSNQSKWQWWKGLIVFGIVMAFIIALRFLKGYIGDPVSYIIEFGILTIAIIIFFIKKPKFKEVFPVRKITGRDFGGMMLLWLGANRIGGIGTTFTKWIGTDPSVNTMKEFEPYFTVSGFVFMFVTACILAPFCEEIITRGIITSYFRNIDSDFAIIAIVGVMFGLMHLDPDRICGTAVLGMIITMLFVTRNNILLPILFHFLNNAYATLAEYFVYGYYKFLMDNFFQGRMSTQYTVNPSTTSLSLGITFVLMVISAFPGPLLIVLGYHVLKFQPTPDENGNMVIPQRTYTLGWKVKKSLLVGLLCIVVGIVLGICGLIIRALPFYPY